MNQQHGVRYRQSESHCRHESKPHRKACKKACFTGMFFAAKIYLKVIKPLFIKRKQHQKSKEERI